MAFVVICVSNASGCGCGACGDLRARDSRAQTCALLFVSAGAGGSSLDDIDGGPLDRELRSSGRRVVPRRDRKICNRSLTFAAGYHILPLVAIFAAPRALVVERLRAFRLFG